MDKSKMGNRMKGYEKITRTFLMENTPVIIRIDGKAFHTYTKPYEFPFSDALKDVFLYTIKKTLLHLQGFTLGYYQSDEVSFFIENYKNIKSDLWFDGNIQKITSVIASIFTGYFNEYAISLTGFTDTLAFFDARTFNIPKEEIVNYFYWRYKDNKRNYIQSLASEYYSHKDRQGKNTQQLFDMIESTGVDVYKDIPSCYRNGTFFYKEKRIIDKIERKVLILDPDVNDMYAKFDFFNETFVFDTKEKK